MSHEDAPPELTSDPGTSAVDAPREPRSPTGGAGTGAGSPGPGSKVASWTRAGLGRVWSALTRPWWREPPGEFRRRWQRFLLQGPIGLIVGLAFGILAGQRWGVSPPVLGIVCGIGGLVFMYLLGQVESFARVRGGSGKGPPPALYHVGGDLIGGGAAGWLLSRVLDTDAATTLAMGASVLAAYGFVATRLLWGTLIDDLVRFMTGNAAGARGPDYSRQQALAARGQVDEALELYEEMCRQRPGHADPMIHAAWMLREARRYEESIEWYRRALATPRLDPRRADIFCRHIWEIAATKLEDAAAAVPDLEAYLERYPDQGESQDWARREILELGGTLPPSSEDPGEAGPDTRDPEATCPSPPT